MAIDLPPIPQNKIEEIFVWRDWLNKLRTAVLTASTTTGGGGASQTTYVINNTTVPIPITDSQQIIANQVFGP